MDKGREREERLVRSRSDAVLWRPSCKPGEGATKPAPGGGRTVSTKRHRCWAQTRTRRDSHGM